jgi:hypothetical protein
VVQVAAAAMAAADAPTRILLAELSALSAAAECVPFSPQISAQIDMP